MKNHEKKLAYLQRLFCKISSQCLNKLLFFFFINCSGLLAQNSWKIGLGHNVTQYHFFDSKALPVNFLKQGSGNSFSISSESIMLDTLNLVGQTTRKAIYFLNHHFLKTLLSHLTYEFGLNFNQYNSVGDVQKIQIIYQTNYLGLYAAVGPYIHLTKNIYLSIKGALSIQKIVQGSQLFNNQYIDLMQEAEFNELMIFPAFSITMTKKLSKGLSLFVQSQQSKSFNRLIEGQENLNFSVMNFSFGLKIQK